MHYRIQYKMTSFKEINIKNHAYYFFDDMISIKNPDKNYEKSRWMKTHTKIFLFTKLDTSLAKILAT